MPPTQIKIKMDRGALIKSADGKVTLGGNPGCVTWVLIVILGLATAGVGILTLSLIPKLFSLSFLDTLGNIFETSALTLFLGFTTGYFFNSAKRGKVTIDPSTKIVRIGKREIPFAEIGMINSQSDSVPLMEGVVAVTFFAVLKSGEQVNLGNISGEPKKIDDRAAQIVAILHEGLAG